MKLVAKSNEFLNGTFISVVALFANIQVNSMLLRFFRHVSQERISLRHRISLSISLSLLGSDNRE